MLKTMKLRRSFSQEKKKESPPPPRLRSLDSLRKRTRQPMFGFWKESFAWESLFIRELDTPLCSFAWDGNAVSATRVLRRLSCSLGRSRLLLLRCLFLFYLLRRELDVLGSTRWTSSRDAERLPPESSSLQHCSGVDTPEEASTPQSLGKKNKEEEERNEEMRTNGRDKSTPRDFGWIEEETRRNESSGHVLYKKGTWKEKMTQDKGTSSARPI